MSVGTSEVAFEADLIDLVANGRAARMEVSSKELKSLASFVGDAQTLVEFWRFSAGTDPATEVDFDGVVRLHLLTKEQAKSIVTSEAKYAAASELYKAHNYGAPSPVDIEMQKNRHNYYNTIVRQGLTHLSDELPAITD
jgi:hypothetical protein